MRDARVIAIYEGTTGMQAQDLVHRNLLRDGGGAMAALVRRIRAETADATPDAAGIAADIATRFEALSRSLLAGECDADLAADGYLRAGWVLVSAWMARRLLRTQPRLGSFRLHQLPAEMAVPEAACRLPPALVEEASA